MPGLFDLTTNYSFYAVPAAWLVAFYPHAVTLALARNIDRTVPRTFGEKIEQDQTLDKATRAKIHRCEGAQSNGFENMGLFAAAVTAGNLAGLPAENLNLLAGGYVASRVLFNIFYINGTNGALATARSLTFFAGLGLVMTLFIQSGNALSSSVLA